jgi:hypothetical protein
MKHECWQKIEDTLGAKDSLGLPSFDDFTFIADLMPVLVFDDVSFLPDFCLFL